MEPWSSRYLTRRSRTTLGEMSDTTRRKNSMEVSRLEVQVRHMDREAHARTSDLNHEQLILQRSVTAHGPSTARRASLTNSTAAFDAMKQREKDKMQALDGKCKSFVQTGGRGREEDNGEDVGDGCSTDEAPSPPVLNGQQLQLQQNHQYRKHHIPTVHHIGGAPPEESERRNRRSSDSPPTDGDHPIPTLTPVANLGGRAARREQRERRYGVAHATDVHLIIDPAEQENKTIGGYSPLRRTNLQQHKFRRTSSTSPNSQHSNSSQGLTSRTGRPKREALDATVRGQQLGGDVVIQPLLEGNGTSPEDANTLLQSRRKSLPVVMGRQMTRHDRSSKSRESLLLPNLGQGRSPSPIGDMRVKVTYADGEEFSSVTDVPFKPHIIRSQKSLLQDSAGHLSSARGPRLEIDLSIPMASASSNPSSPRANDRRTSRREKTYTV